jgi:hypothetical protein
MSSDQATTAGSAQASRPRRAPARPDPLGLIQGLDRLREVLHQRLDRIETMALERGDAPAADPTAREQELCRRIAELEERHTRLVAEAKRREQEWQNNLEQLENDRQLLAEAWARIERERIEHAGTGSGTGTGSGSGHAASTPAAAPTPVFRPAVTGDPDDVISHAILRQFQALRSDVRRNATGRRPHR